MRRNGYRPEALIETLHSVQSSFGYLDDDALRFVSGKLHVSPSQVYGVATFYHFFSLKPQGEHTCTVCMGTACYVKRAAEIIAQLQAEFGVEPGQTTADGKFSLATARCLGSCGLAPVLVVDSAVLGRETPESTLKYVRALVSGQPSNGRQESGVPPPAENEAPEVEAR